MGAKRNADICVLVSGGLDSAVLVSESAKKYRRVFPLYVRMGLRWEQAELYWLRQFLTRLNSSRVEPLHVVELPVADVYGKHWSITGNRVPNSHTPDAAVYLPGRNLLLLAKAVTFCGRHRIPAIALASLAHNPFPDARPAFFRQFSQLATQALGQPLLVSAPYRRLSKAQLLWRNAQLPLHLTFSCLAPRGRLHCGHCNKCAERQHAFRNAKIQDLTHYANSGRNCNSISRLA